MDANIVIVLGILTAIILGVNEPLDIKKPPYLLFFFSLLILEKDLLIFFILSLTLFKK